MALDEAEEAEVVPATVAELVDAVTAREAGPDTQGRPTFTTTSPKWWVHGRVFGGMVVAQALSAALRTVPAGLEVHSLHGYFLRPTSPGSQTTHVVDRLRDGRSFSTRQVTSDVEGRKTFRMTSSFHVPEEGDSYQLPITPEIPPPAEVDGFEAPFPFDIRELGATERREDGTYQSTRRCWFRTREPLSDDPAVHAGVLAYFSDMTGASFRPHSPGRLGHPHRRQSGSRPVVPPALAGRHLELLRPPCTRERRGEGDHPCNHARRGRHLAPEHGPGAVDPRARRTAADHVPAVDRPKRSNTDTDGRGRWDCLRARRP